MKTFLGVVVVALAAGCGTDVTPATTQQSQEVRTCDTPDCLLSNGGGVYTEELGDAGIGPEDFMITHFVNLGGGVTIVGRANDPQLGWTTMTGEIANALIDDTGAYPGTYWVTAVDESLTTPTFTVSNGTQTHAVAGLGLLHLQLQLKLPGGDFLVSFAGHTSESRPNGSPTGQATLQEFDMRWNAGSTLAGTTQSYCTRAPVTDASGITTIADDPAVFQRGIDVDPVTAVTSRNGNDVTLSCRHGAIATVRLWGYVYRNTQDQLDMFEAAMHMKRASYCGDETFYTRANTDIWIHDSDDVNTDPVTAALMEASWGRVGSNGPLRALCVNMANRRHRFVNWPPDPSGSDFNGHCLDGSSIPLNNCPFPPLNHTWWILDQKSP